HRAPSGGGRRSAPGLEESGSPKPWAGAGRRRAAVGWTVVILGCTVVFWLEETLGLPVSNHIAAQDHAAQSLFNRITTLLALAGMAISFVVERNRSHAQLREALDSAEAAQATSQVFLATMSHELRTPLNAILGYSQLVMEQVECGDAGPFLTDLAKIERSGHHLLGLVDDVLTLSKLDAGALQVRSERVDVAEVVKESVSSIDPLLQLNRNAMDVSCAPDLVAIADGFRLRQVLLNLLSNAAKFTHDGRVSIEVSDPDDEVRISVRDTGIGIPAHKIDRIFERFEQADDSTTRRFGGTGLGLAICKELVASMHGRIGVRSREGVGTEFTVHIPGARHDASTVPAEDALAEGA
ncbi:MAG: HAMP domain-containing sensor histidine kinase, partial [Myxococcota bacterium]